MPRIRTIKPALWDDEKLATCSLPARLVFIGCISQADDEGKLRAAASKIRSQLFSYDDFTVGDVDGWLVELHKAGMIDLYATADGQRYARIPTWSKHQRINRFNASELPDPSSAAPILERAIEQGIHDTLTTHAVSVCTPSAPGREREKEGSGEELTLSSVLSAEPVAAPKKAPSGPSDDQVRKVFDAWAKLFGRNANIKLDEKRRRRIRWALKEYGPALTWDSLRGHAANPWRHEKPTHNEIATLFRDAANFEAGLEQWRMHNGVGLSAAAPTRDTIREMGY